MGANAPHRRRVVRRGRQGLRFLTPPEARGDLALLDVGQAHPEKRGHLQPEIVHRHSVAQGALAVADRPVPLSERVRGRGQMRQGAPRPPPIPERLERAEPPLAHLDTPMKLTREDVHLSETGLREGAQLEQAAALRDRDRLRAMRDGGLRATPGQAEENPSR